MSAIPAPYIWQVELTNHCPYHCLGCPRQRMKRETGFMEFSTFQAAILSVREVQKAFRPLGLHHFGESLLHPRLPEFVAYADQQGVPTTLSCNPDRLSPRVALDLLEAGLARVTFSLDALDTPTLRRIRGTPADYIRAERAILDFIDQRERLGSYCEIRLQMIAYKINRHQWQPFLKKWRAYPVYAYIKRFDSWTIPGFAPLGAAPMRHACAAPFESVVLLWDGRIVPCCHDFDGELTMGHISDGLDTVWNASAFQGFREQFSARSLPPGHLCRRCAWWLPA